MCFNRNKQQEAKAILQQYVSEADPHLNKELRDGKEPIECKMLDTLFVDSLPSVLYRILPLQELIIENGVIQNKAYLSTCESFEDFFNKTFGNDLVCIRIKTDNRIHGIKITNLLPEVNDESEYLLPRGLKLIVNKQKRYYPDEFDSFLQEVQATTMNAKTLIVDGIQSYTLVEATIE